MTMKPKVNETNGFMKAINSKNIISYFIETA